MMALILTIVLVVITLTESLWLMYHLNAHTTPMSSDMSRRVPRTLTLGVGG
ncbi:hypothetical protein [Sphingobium sp. LB126]|uniref:hypothetical protein n=1 Tax=Sphingobium sp. LB126 TaxID=1983755 RepID=UPI0012FDE370|nr:hypothetical protein [Sphingobium sp. LB126]